MKGIIHIFRKTTFGQISLALLMVCLASGIILAIPYDVNKAYESISFFMIVNPSANLIRNLHYWSAQLFLIFSILHLWEHFKRKIQITINAKVWFRLSLGLLVIFLAMLTGFLLKADADSMQARRILNELITGLPLIGKLLSYSFLGPDESLQLIYVHHIATLSIFLIIIILEHAKSIWPGVKTFVISSLILLLLSLLFMAPLHDNLNPVVKGPWYFVGLQELLHWMSAPIWSLFLIFSLILLIYIIPFVPLKPAHIIKRSLLIVTFAYLFISLFAYFFRGPNWEMTYPGQENYSYYTETPFHHPQTNFLSPFTQHSPVSSIPTVMERKESCMVCHQQLVGFSSSHQPEAVGCFACHGGIPFSLDKTRSHTGMRSIPGNLENAALSCGTTNCHPDISRRIGSGLMARLSGMISVDRFVFNEQDSPDGLTDIHQLGQSAADEHLRNMCVRCHLGNPKSASGPITQESRGGGCLACHLNYDALATTAWFEHQKNEEDTAYLHFHPAVNMQVSNEHCFGCHSRSGRISTNYEGWHETILEKEDMPQSEDYRLVENKRVFTYIQEDAHHRLGMICIDCHNSFEIMGDGTLYQHEEQQVNIRCGDCHFEKASHIVEQKNLDTESAKIAAMRFGDVSGRRFLATADKMRPLVNTFLRNDSAFMISKNSHQTYVLSAPASICTKGETHQQLSCSSCHSGWAPSCIGCHNSYDADEPGFNMLTNKEIQGSWTEYIGNYHAQAPALGMRQNAAEKTVVPVVPGMVLTIDIGSFSKNLHDSLIFQRLFAPAAPHTTQAKGRSCVSCHNNPVALGYGNGKLLFDGGGQWTFEPFYQNNPNDGLPEDAWIPFLQSRTGKVSTRSDIRPFSIEEQERILSVGACLSCHDGQSAVMQESLIDFKKLVARKKPTCLEAVY